jgi:hypothetical protein
MRFRTVRSDGAGQSARIYMYLERMVFVDIRVVEFGDNRDI